MARAAGFIGAMLALTAGGLLAGRLAAQPAPAPDGAALWAQRCASCHDNVSLDNRAPPRVSLAARPSSDIVQALTRGAMVQMAQGLSPAEIDAIALYVTGKAPVAAAAPAADRNTCPTHPPIDAANAAWTGWGRDLANTRYQPAPGLKPADAPRLKLKWAFAYPGGVNSQPVLVGGRVFVASFAGKVYSLDAKSGCVHWRRDETGAVRTALEIGPLGGKSGRLAAFYGDSASVVHALDATSGAPIWQAKVEDHPRAVITGSPVLYKGRLYVPLSSLEEGVSLDRKYGCCTFRGSVVALDAATGKVLWKTYAIAQAPAPTKVNAAGAQMYGPAGAAIWSAPTIDPKRGVLYVATGDSYTDAPNTGSDAVIAMDLASGKVRWTRQVTEHDNYLVGCYGQKGQPPNCPDTVGPDHDFGASVILRTLKNGHDVLLAGQKSGMTYALDPDHEGKVIWSTRVGGGGALGGVEWGMAAGPDVLYAGVADTVTAPGKGQPGLVAVSIADGKLLWRTPAPGPCSAKVVANLAGFCATGLSAAVSAAPGLVIAGSMDGRLRAYDAKDGKVLWDFPGGGVPFTAVNVDAPVSGGGYNGAGAAIGGGMVFHHLGYRGFNPGGMNLLLAFSVDGK
jgi:polyvinyl alcohol dehydrogenase (cytochrome)